MITECDCRISPGSVPRRYSSLGIESRCSKDSLDLVPTRSEGKERGFNRLVAVFEHARDGWLCQNIEQSRPLWALARRIEQEGRPAAVRLHIVSDRCISRTVRVIEDGLSREQVPISFQIWDVSRLRRMHEAGSVREDLEVDFADPPGGGLTVLPAAVGEAGYDAHLAAVPATVLAETCLRYGSRLLEGSIRMFLGRRGSVNTGIAATIQKEPSRFFAYNNGIATTASAVQTITSADGTLRLRSATDLRIVNGAQTTASLARAMRDRKNQLDGVFVPMKLSVVAPEAAAEMIPRISRHANSQNGVRASNFFANHPFHRRIEEVSRRVLAPAVGGSQVQTHWHYERARGQYLNDQAGLAASKREQFQRLNPRRQLITKTDLAKIESCFEGLPDLACKGAEKSFVAFAERVAKAWQDESLRAGYGDDWFRHAVARVMLFRAIERIVSEAPWYEGGYRAQIVAHTAARLARLARERAKGGGLELAEVWASQQAGTVLERQIGLIAELVHGVLHSPPKAGRNLSEWAEQQACTAQASETPVPVVSGFDGWIVDAALAKGRERAARGDGRVDREVEAIRAVLGHGADYWTALRGFAQARKLLSPDDQKRLSRMIGDKSPNGIDARALQKLARRCEASGFSPSIR